MLSNGAQRSGTTTDGNGSTPLSVRLAPQRPRGLNFHTGHTMEIDRTWVLPLVSTYTW